MKIFYPRPNQELLGTLPSQFTTCSTPHLTGEPDSQAVNAALRPSPDTETQPQSAAPLWLAPPTNLDYNSFNPEWIDPNPPDDQIADHLCNGPIINIQLAKRIVLIPEMWEELKLPGYPKASCSSPFRRDRKPSFSIYDKDRRWMDHSTGENGDVVDFIAMAYRFYSLTEAKAQID